MRTQEVESGYRLRQILLIIFLSIWALPFYQTSFATSPLSIHPKLGVLQRGHSVVKVITKERGNKIYKDPSASSDVVETVEALRIFFVFPAEDGKPMLTKNDFFYISWSPKKEDMVGWIHKDNVQEWYHREIAQFTSLAGRKQALVFASEEDLLNSLREPDDPENLTRAISREPADASQQRQDVLLPIIDFGLFNEFFQIAYLHQVGIAGRGMSIANTTVDIAGTQRVPNLAELKGLLDSFKLDVMFVVDTTNGMQPFIDNLDMVAKQLFREAKGLKVGGGVRIGLVGYRDRVKDQRAMGFVVRRF